MSKDPAFLFYSSDFLSGISDLTMEERGQFITLLCLQHQKGFLNDKTIRLSVGNVSVDVLSKFKKDKDGNFFNSRLLEETEKRNKFTQSRRNNGNLGGRPPKNRDEISEPNNNLEVNHMDNHMEDVNEIENKDEIKKVNDEIPEFSEFLIYAKEKEPSVNESALKNKYDAWVVNDWKDGNDSKIKNWKTKLLHTMPYITKNEKFNNNGKPGTTTTAKQKPIYRKTLASLENKYGQAETSNPEGELFEDTEYTEVE